jgi:hypothetical protein
VQPFRRLGRLKRIDTTEQAGEDPETMAKLNHQKRQRPKPPATRRRRAALQRTEERRSRQDLERWRRGA